MIRKKPFHGGEETSTMRQGCSKLRELITKALKMKSLIYRRRRREREEKKKKGQMTRTQIKKIVTP